MSTITIRLNSDEEKSFSEYAKLHGIPLSTLFKQTLEERIEDEMDRKAIAEYDEKVKNGSAKFFDNHEVKKILGL